MAQGKGSWSPSFEISSPIVTLHEPIYVEFSVRNGTNEQREFDLGKNRKTGFEFTVIEPDGRATGPLRLTEAGFGAPGRITLAPGQTYTQKLLLNEWYGFPGPGDYKLQARFVAPSGSRTGLQRVTYPLQEMDVRVGPRNPKRLEQLCQSLGETAGSESPSDSYFAGLALSYVEDVVAIPYLEHLAGESESLRGTAVAGLGRIANAEGVERVIASLNSKDPRLISEIRTQVEYIRHGVKVAD